MIAVADVDPNAIYNVVHMCRAEIIDQVRDASLIFFQSMWPDYPATRENMLPSRLSPTGDGEPTHYLCYMPDTSGRDLIKMIEYREATGLDTHLYVVPDKMTFIAQQGLQFIINAGVSPQ